MIFFVHIPKTAGTSFRIGAADYFGDDHIYGDYGLCSGDTSNEIRLHAYNSLNLNKVKSLARDRGIRLLTGHVPASKYHPIVGSSDITTFLRHPVAQVISHFEHHSRHSGYDKSLEEFVVDARFQNVQSRALNGLPLELYGFLGITERYNDSIDMFNLFYDVELPKLALNRKSSRKGHTPKFNSLEELDQKTFDFIAEQNSTDMRIYELASDIFNERHRLYEGGHKYAMGYIGVQTETLVGGVAYTRESQQALELEVLVNGQIDGECKATETRPFIRTLNVPRRGAVGFTYHFTKPMRNGDDITVQVKATGQVLQHRKSVI